MLLEALAGGLAGAAAVTAYGVRGKSSQLFGTAVFRGPADEPGVALTFDDGPHESTPELLAILSGFGVHATFFQCGQAVRQFPGVAREVARDGHELGNHSDTHPLFCFAAPGAIRAQLRQAQQTIADATGQTPRWFRPPFGVRWFGLKAALEEENLRMAMWTVIGRDWKLPAEAVVRRVAARVQPGAIICLHDGRLGGANTTVRETIDATRQLVPLLLERGYHFKTLSQLCPKP